jgi:dihydrofolate reductase
VIKDNVAEEISKLKDEVAGVILVAGSIQLVKTLMENDLVDEYRLMVFPVVLGSGKRLFGEASDPKTLKLVDTKQVGPDGIVVQTYEPA